MKFLKLKFIIPTILAVVLIVFLGLFFIGGLKASADIKYDNEEFNKSDYIHANEIGLSDGQLVYNNGTYSMFIDEKTTIVKVVLNSSCDAPDSPSPSKCSVVYETADSTSDVASEKSNFLLRYFLNNGTINSTDLSSWANSVQYENRITGLTERHYSLNYLEDGVDVLYEIGNFTNVSSYFPTQFDRATFDSMFRGNLVFYNETERKLLEQKGDIELKFTGQGATYSAECAAYLEENGLATVTEEKDTSGNSLGAWRLDNLLDNEGRLKAKLGKDYNTNALEGEEGYSPCTANPFSTSSIINYIYSNTVYELESTINGDTENRLNIFPTQYTENSSQIFKFKAARSTIIITNLLKYMYTINEYDEDGNQTKENYYQVYDSTARINRNVYYDYTGNGEKERFKIGGFQAQDEDGRWLYDDNGYPIQAGFTQELAEEQNALFGHDEEAKSTSFQVGIRFRLTDEGFKVTLLNESIEEQSESKIYQIQLLPYFTVNNDSKSEGHIVIPDGSGAVISFNSVKDVQNADAYNKKIYGYDYTIPQQEFQFTGQSVMFGMYGFLDYTKERGIVAIIDKGASLSWLQADFLRANQTTSYNYARFATDLRTYEVVSLTSGSSFNKWTKDIYPGDIVYEYRFLDKDDLTYVGVANSYREYLLEKYSDIGFGENDKTTTHAPSINFLGAMDKKVLTFGVVHDKDFALTRYDQAVEILKELKENGVNTANVSYSAWTKDGYKTEFTSKVKASKVLGGEKGLNYLRDYLESENIPLYLQTNVQYNTGFDYLFGSLKYSPKSITSNYSTISTFVASTGLIDSSGITQGMISPRFYEAYVNNYLKSIDRFAIKGIIFSDLGSVSGDYSKKNLIYTETGFMYQQKVLEMAKKEGYDISLICPNDKILPYASSIVNVPVTATMLPCIDYSIPLYQLVISGLVDYSSATVNYQNNEVPEWHFLKALETGSNLGFTLSAEDTKILLDTHYTHDYGAYYLNWKHKIVRLNNMLNETGIYESRLISHEYVTDNVVKVEYANGLKLMINFDDSTYQDTATGLAIAGNWYIVL